MCLGVREEPRSRQTRCPPHFFRLNGARGVEREAAADVASVRVRVVNDDVSRRVRRVLAVADEPLAGAPALLAIPLSSGHSEGVILLEEGPEGGERFAEGRPLVLLGAQAVLRLRLAPALQACVVFAEVLDVVPFGAPDLF